MGAQKIMLQEIESQFGGTANAMADTASGKLKQAMNQLGEAGEAIGAQLAPAIEKVAGLLAGFGNGFAALPGPIQAVVVGFGAIVAAAGPLIWAAGSVMTSLSTLMKIDWSGGFNKAKQAIGGFSSAVQGGMSQAISAIRNMSTGSLVAFGAVGAAVVAAGFALNYFVNEQAENARKRFKTLNVSVDSLRTSFQLLASDNTLVGGLEDLPTVLQDIQKETEGAYNWFSALRVSGENGEIGPVAKWFTTVDDNAKRSRESIASWDAQLSAIDASQGVAQFQALAAQADALGYSLPLDLFPQLKSNIETAAATAGMSVEEFMEMAGAGGQIKTEFEQATEALDDWETEVRAQFSPLFAYGDSLNAIAEAQRRQQEAALVAMDAVARHGEGSALAQPAVDAYHASIRDTALATIDAGFQLEQLKAGLQTGAIDFDTAALHLDGLVASGLMTEEQARLTKDEWALLAWQVAVTPSSKVIEVSAPGLSAVSEALGNIQTKLSNITSFGGRINITTDGPGNAAGGPVFGGQAGWVGERGKELFVPSTDGVIIPHYESRRMAQGTSAGPATATAATYNITINGLVGRDKQDVLEFLARELPKAAATHARSYG
jgi:hypothetical protein